MKANSYSFATGKWEQGSEGAAISSLEKVMKFVARNQTRSRWYQDLAYRLLLAYSDQYVYFLLNE